MLALIPVYLIYQADKKVKGLIWKKT
jgi:hypothetical protein